MENKMQDSIELKRLLEEYAYILTNSESSRDIEKAFGKVVRYINREVTKAKRDGYAEGASNSIATDVSEVIEMVRNDERKNIDSEISKAKEEILKGTYDFVEKESGKTGRKEILKYLESELSKLTTK